ncbi:MAG: NfeD family protein [Gallionella sp.]
MEPYIYWFVLGLGLIILEMSTGTFYLLVLGIAMITGGLAALLGASLIWQLVVCAVVAATGTVILRRYKGGQPDQASSTSNLDEGQSVKVLKWHDDGSARVFYRGAEWDARTEDSDTPHNETLYIKSLQGSALVLTHHKPQ